MALQADLRDQKHDLMSNPDSRDTILRMAYEHGMSLEDAQVYYLRHNG